MYSPPSSAKSLGVLFTFAGTTFVAAALLFLLEPLVGKSLLPSYGGTPAVWNTCVFFFQLVLLLGYVYAHLLHRSLTMNRQLTVHVLVMAGALLSLPIQIHVVGLTNSAKSPVLSLLFDLMVTVGPAFFVISTTTPLLQAWFASTRTPVSPYLLYVASNAGSLLGLLLYPTIVEFSLPLSGQFRLVSWCFAGMVGLLGVCGFMACQAQSTPKIDDASAEVMGSPITFKTRLDWFTWSLCPSSLMLGATTYLSTEVAPMPAIWMLPLGLYLLSFIIAFAQPPQWILTASSICYACLTIGLSVWGLRFTGAAWVDLLLHNGLLFCGSLALHGRLAATQPSVKHLTEFYLWISLGGLCGSVCNTLIAPILFNWQAEYTLAIVLGLCLIPWPNFTTPWLKWSVLTIRPTLCLGAFVGLSWFIYFSPLSRSVIYRERTFFGQFHILKGDQGRTLQLVHGRTVHGMQMVSQNDRERRRPLTYYFYTGPIGQLLLSGKGTPLSQTVGVVGLGVGSLAAFAEEYDDYTFYEIDPAISRIATSGKFFRYLSDAKARGAAVQVVLGDARLKLREAPDHHYGILVLDAFTSDSVPVHLLTKDAIQEYISKLRPDGVLAFHISNRYVELEPVLANIAHELGYAAYSQNEYSYPIEEFRRGKQTSHWLVMSATTAPIQPILDTQKWTLAKPRPELGVWTDDRSNLLSIMRWGK